MLKTKFEKSIIFRESLLYYIDFFESEAFVNVWDNAIATRDAPSINLLGGVISHHFYEESNITNIIHQE